MIVFLFNNHLYLGEIEKELKNDYKIKPAVGQRAWEEGEIIKIKKDRVAEVDAQVALVSHSKQGIFFGWHFESGTHPELEKPGIEWFEMGNYAPDIGTNTLGFTMEKYNAKWQ